MGTPRDLFMGGVGLLVPCSVRDKEKPRESCTYFPSANVAPLSRRSALNRAPVEERGPRSRTLASSGPLMSFGGSDRNGIAERASSDPVRDRTGVSRSSATPSGSYETTLYASEEPSLLERASSRASLSSSAGRLSSMQPSRLGVTGDNKSSGAILPSTSSFSAAAPSIRPDLLRSNSSFEKPSSEVLRAGIVGLDNLGNTVCVVHPLFVPVSLCCGSFGCVTLVAAPCAPHPIRVLGMHFPISI